MPKISMRDALRDALHEEMARDDTIIVLGEDVIAHGGPYAITRGIHEKYPGRIRQTPISEAGIVGTALGAALCGMRPVAEIMYVDFITCAMDEVVNQMAKIRYMFGGQTDVPVVLRLPSGSARRFLVVRTDRDITLVDLSDLDRSEITVKLLPKPVKAQVVLAARRPPGAGPDGHPYRSPHPHVIGLCRDGGARGGAHRARCARRPGRRLGGVACRHRGCR